MKKVLPIREERAVRTAGHQLSVALAALEQLAVKGELWLTRRALNNVVRVLGWEIDYKVSGSQAAFKKAAAHLHDSDIA